MKKLLFPLALLASISVLSGCATSDGKPVDIVDADRSAGIVEIGYVHVGAPLIDNGEGARWDMAISLADSVCKRWGYQCADLLTPHSVTKGILNGYGQLLNGTVSRKYMCLESGCPAPQSSITESRQ